MYSLNTPIGNWPRVNKKILSALKYLKIRTIGDLLFYFPSRYDDFSNLKKIKDVELGETVTISGDIENIKTIRTFRQKMFLTEAVIADDTGRIKAIWFNQPFLASNLKQGQKINLSGKITRGPKGIYLQNPAHEKISPSTFHPLPPTFHLPHSRPIHTGGLVAVYPETRGITSRWLRFLIKNSIGFRNQLTDSLPRDIREKYNLPEIKQAVFRIHFPKSPEESETARKRFDFEEMLVWQIHALKEKLALKQKPAPVINLDLELLKGFVNSLPFKLTDAQRRSIWEIANDMQKPRPMNRLLEGDVGSGKTVVAAAAVLLAVKSRHRAAFMAPTEILACQHFETLQKVLKPFGIKIGLLTGSNKKYSLDTELIVGTHALIQKNASLENFGLVVVDEQHRFGVQQRAALIRSQNTNLSESTKQQKIVEKELSYILTGLFFKVQKKLGRFCRERQYGDMLERELQESGLLFERENPIQIADRKSNFADFIVENKIVVDLKTKPFLEKSDYLQMKRYLEISGLELGLLVNFQDKYLKPKRILNSRKFVDSNKFVASDRLIPHFLSMSATPIPRTLALTVYGDLDLSVLDELPKYRREILTKIVEPGKRQETYNFIREEVKKGRQVFVICPRIEASDERLKTKDKNRPNSGLSFSSFGLQQKLLLWEVKAVKEEYQKLKEKIFPDLKVEMLHGKMKPKEKKEIMEKFRKNETNILVSTSVIEVGVDVPNASIMMIEGAEKFGLAQLYQFRGRVGRGAEQSYCYLFPTEEGLNTRRLRAVVEAKNGFELAEKDLQIRGPGEVFGVKQWGESRAVNIAVTNPRLVREVRAEAELLIKKDPELKNCPLLLQKIQNLEKITHLE